MILFSLEDPKDVTLCGGGKRVRDWSHLRRHPTAVSIQANKQDGTGSTYGYDTTWICVDAWRYVHRHHRGALAVAKVWRRERSKP